MKRREDPPVELLIALQSDWCERRIMTEDGRAELAKVGRWIVLRRLSDEDDFGERIVLSMQAYECESEDDAACALDVLLQEVPVG